MTKNNTFRCIHHAISDVIIEYPGKKCANPYTFKQTDKGVYDCDGWSQTTQENCIEVNLPWIHFNSTYFHDNQIMYDKSLEFSITQPGTLN